MNYFLEVPPLSLENLQQIRFSSSVSSEMISYSSYTLLCALTKEGGNSYLCYWAIPQPWETTSPLCSPFVHHLPHRPGRPSASTACPERSPDPAQVQLEDTSTLGTPHFSPTLSSPSPAATWLVLLLLAMFHPKPQPSSCLQPAPLLPPAPGVTNPLNEGLTGAALPPSLNGAAIAPSSEQSPIKLARSRAGS